MPRRDLGVDVVLVERAVAGEGRHRPVDLVEHRTGLRAVVDILVRQRRRDDPAGVGVHADVEFAPRPAAPAAALEELVAPPEAGR
jgi:hypothetical protein